VRDFHKNQFSTRPALDESTAGSHMFERQRLEATSYPLGAQRVSALPWLNHRPWLDGSLSVWPPTMARPTVGSAKTMVLTLGPHW